ncbi:hypothetical protein [Bacillus sp. Cr_A10]|uniref:hypothetical protein n=1 Tax=Bacillaceae TaxID=186817 RepID=UPI0023DB1A5A|nr:hypothetical protein [Bacillus sp. Cr_A10]MDF2068622.1 hypothetical protein [Bacillus sp. Cr_A10]
MSELWTEKSKQEQAECSSTFYGDELSSGESCIMTMKFIRAKKISTVNRGDFLYGKIPVFLLNYINFLSLFPSQQVLFTHFENYYTKF